VHRDVITVLCREERYRAAQILRPLVRERWRRSRGVLRAVLGAYVEEDPAALRFVLGPHGKPALRVSSSAEEDRIHFNLAHSQSMLLIALSVSGEVGVDVETSARGEDVTRVASRKPGARAGETLAGSSHGRNALRAWTRREAELKWQGVGLGGPRDQQTREGHPWIIDLDLGQMGAGALAADDPPDQLETWQWPSSQHPFRGD
jgi:4'-phosphopantetheinyl transferase